MPKRKPRRPTSRSVPAPGGQGGTRPPPLPGLDVDDAVARWRWRTFPVLCALVAGLLIGAFTHSPDTDLAVAVRVVAIFGAAYVIVHLVATNIVVAGRIKRRPPRRARGRSPDDDYEDVVIAPDEH